MFSLFQQVRQNKEIFPLLAVVSVALVFAGGTIANHLKNDPEVVLRHSANPFPWQKVPADQTRNINFEKEK